MARQCIDGTFEERALQVLGAVDKYRGPMPTGSLMAINEHESNLGENCYNTQEVFSKGVSIGHAIGPWQIMEGYVKDFGVTTTTAYDLDKSTKGVCKYRLVSHKSIEKLVPELFNDRGEVSDLRTYTYLLYLSHFAGRGGMESSIAKARKTGAVTPERTPGYGHEAGLLETADRAAYWEQWAIDQRGAPVPFQESPQWLPILLGATMLATVGVAIYLHQTNQRPRWLPQWVPA